MTRYARLWAYLAMFCSASRQQKYTAASVSCGKRPIPSASTATGSEDLLACALSAAASPRSAGSGGWWMPAGEVAEVFQRACGICLQFAEDLFGRVLGHGRGGEPVT